jgi:hypothetical protein
MSGLLLRVAESKRPVFSVILKKLFKTKGVQIRMQRFAFFLLPAMFAVIFTSASAQSFQGGIYAGINTSQITGDDLAGYNKLSAAAGVFGRRTFGDKWAFMMELGYLGKGSKKNLSPRDSIQRKGSNPETCRTPAGARHVDHGADGARQRDLALWIQFRVVHRGRSV